MKWGKKYKKYFQGGFSLRLDQKLSQYDEMIFFDGVGGSMRNFFQSEFFWKKYK